MSTPTNPEQPPVDPAVTHSAPPVAPSAYPAATQPGAYPAAPAQTTTPGKGLAIAGFVLAFLVPPVGVIVSIIALIKLGKVGGKKGLAIAGIIVGIVFTIGWIFIAITFAALLAGAATMLGTCAELGPGVWNIDGMTIECE